LPKSYGQNDENPVQEIAETPPGFASAGQLLAEQKSAEFPLDLTHGDSAGSKKGADGLRIRPLA
jgi:hypothetical protein